MVDQVSIRLRNEPAVYFPGKRLEGQVEIALTRCARINAVRLYCLGEACTKKVEAKSKFPNGKLVLHAYSAKEVYFHFYTELLKERDKSPLTFVNGALHLNAGDHGFPFEFQLPADCPQSFESSSGSIRYSCKVEVHYDVTEKKVDKQIFTILNGIDLNMPTKKPLSYSAELQVPEKDGRFFTCTLQMGNTRVVPGDLLTTCLRVKHVGKMDKADNLKAQLIQRITYAGFRAGFKLPTHWEERKVVKQSERKIKWNKSKLDIAQVDWPAMNVPAVAPTIDAGCSIIRVQYELLYHVNSGQRQCQTFIVPITVGILPQYWRLGQFVPERGANNFALQRMHRILQPLLSDCADLPLPAVLEQESKQQDVRTDQELNYIHYPIYYIPYTVLYDHRKVPEDSEAKCPTNHRPLSVIWKKTRSVPLVTAEYR